MLPRRLILVAFWTIFLVLAGSASTGAALRYFEMQELVDAVVSESPLSRRVIATMHRPYDGQVLALVLALEVREGILERARRSGLVLADEGLTVTPADGGVIVAVNWAQPALGLVGQSILTFPMSLERTYDARVVR